MSEAWWTSLLSFRYLTLKEIWKTHNLHTESRRKLRKKKIRGAHFKPTSISGGQRPQLDCSDTEASPEYGPWPKSFCAHYNGTWKSVAAPKATVTVCVRVFSGEKNSFMTETAFTDIASFSACVIPTKTHLLLWPVLVLYELWLRGWGGGWHWLKAPCV